MANTGGDIPGSPYWWLERLVNQILTRQPYLDERESYVLGYHPYPTGDRKFMRALAELQKVSRTNYCGLVTSAKVERMRVRGFRFGDAGTVDEDAQSIWNANDMDYQSNKIHKWAAMYGLAYALVTPPDPLSDSKYPVITAEDPRVAIVYRDPMSPTKSLAGLRMWADDLIGHIMAVLYLPDATYTYIGPPTQDTRGWTIQTLRQRLFAVSGGLGGFQLLGVDDNPLGEVGLVEYVWRPESGRIPEGEASVDVRDIQDRINQSMLDRLVISRSQAYKQRWATGINVPKGKKGQRRSPFDLGADLLWVTSNDTAKFGQFESADITMLLDAIRDDVADIAAITKTPAHYLMGKMANVSGETLTQAEAGLISGCKDRAASIGWSHTRLMKLAFASTGDARAKEVDVMTLWNQFGQQLLADAALAVQELTTAGVPLELTLGWLDFSPDEIAFARQYADEQEAKQQALQQQQMQMQHQQAMQLAAAKPQSTGAKPSGGPQNSKSGGTAKPASKPKPTGSTPSKGK